MNSYRSNTNQSATKIRNSQINQSFSKSSSKVSRFPQSKLLVLTIRRIIHSKMRTAYDKIRTVQRPKYHYLNVIQKMSNVRKKEAFQYILAISKNNKLQQLKSETSRVNIKIFLIRMLDKLYNKKLKQGYTSFLNYQIKNQLMIAKINQFTYLLQKTVLIDVKGYAWRKIMSICQKRKIIKIRIVFFNQVFHKLHNKTIKNSFKLLFLHSSQVIQEDLFKKSQAKRKLSYDLQNNRRQLLMNERQHIYNLKQMIQNEAHERSIKQGQMKRNRALKISQTQQKIIIKQKQFENRQFQVFKVQRFTNKLKQIIEKRANLTKRSYGAGKKVQNLYNQIKYQQQVKVPLRTSFMGKIDLNNDKFKSLLKQYDDLRCQVEDFQIYDNIYKSNLICLYENVQTDNIKSSRQYQMALDQNINLKQCMNSILNYNLLKDKGDNMLKQSNDELQGLFEKIFVLTEQDQNGLIEQDLKNSFASLRSSKIVKKKSSLKTSVVSNKSIK